jgi:ligand-binding SRPBCC domain-containing protein
MTTIYLRTEINADQKTVFDLARNIDIHQLSIVHTQEIAIAGITSGLINLNETVTWQGKHFGFHLKHESKITEMKLYDFFTDEMIQGCFKSFRHNHYFKSENNATIMVDELKYETPFGVLGIIFNRLVLKNYLTQLILKRNNFLKKYAESLN